MVGMLNLYLTLTLHTGKTCIHMKFVLKRKNSKLGRLVHTYNLVLRRPGMEVYKGLETRLSYTAKLCANKNK